MGRNHVHSADMAGRAWSTGRKLMGNLIPVAIVAPFGLAGVWLMLRAHDVTFLGITLCLLGLALGWVGVNRFGLYGNANLRAEIQKRVVAKASRDASRGFFVGFARPSYTGLLDAHEDLGFLFLDSEQIEFLGELHRMSIPRSEVRSVRLRPNVHSALGLGRWVSIEGVHKGKPVRMLVESREEPTLLRNKRRGTELRQEILAWLKKS